MGTVCTAIKRMPRKDKQDKDYMYPLIVSNLKRRIENEMIYFHMFLVIFQASSSPPPSSARSRHQDRVVQTRLYPVVKCAICTESLSLCAHFPKQ